MAAKKVTYIATFSNGQTLSRTSSRPYSHAWRTLDEKDNTVQFGFAGRRDLAERAARAIPGHYKCEVTEARLAPEGYAEQLKADKPWRVKRTWPDGRSGFETERGGKHRRWPTKEAAQGFADICNRSDTHPGLAARAVYTATDEK